MKWITRKDIKVDRVACPWLIKRFVDPQANSCSWRRKTWWSRQRIKMQFLSTLRTLTR